ncbi:MAG TPA: serine/threonine-protein kinase, partial [Bryobacteraceae bacterium]|nr:serine/threonine-protein kinase [Bryobacteraceae bacterium]
QQCCDRFLIRFFLCHRNCVTAYQVNQSMPKDERVTTRDSGLTNSQLSRLRQIFDAALEQPPENRDSFLAQACGGDEALRLEVKQLLSAHESNTAWIDRPILDALPPGTRSWEGRSIGQYRIVREIGSGGMATVYLAERQIGKVIQSVALKIVRPVFTTNEQIRRRFEHEREILASLDHPNIARLLDIGSTEDDIPYLVMDYVEGERLDVFCDTRKLDVRARLQLFCTACEAIQYAHSKGVVHRDLKPSNILVTSEGSVRLLDFGIAKVLRVEDRGRTLLTETGAALMTIEYASPEQIRGEEIGAQSDVYSLGVLLFELLTGRRPYRTQGRMMHSVAQAICEEPPIMPSSAVRDVNAERSSVDSNAPTVQPRSGSPNGQRSDLGRELSGDLDSILLKALRKEPKWRYDSPAEFCADIQRHLAGSRVLARADTFRYRMERILRRLTHPATGVFHTQGMMMLTAGLLGVSFLLERQQILWGRKREVNAVMNLSAVAVWFCWALWEGRRMTRAGKLSALDRQSWTVFTAITVVFGVLSLVSELRIVITPEAMAIFWNAGLAIGLLIIGMQTSQALTVGGVILFISAVVASFNPDVEYLWLAGGILCGLVAPGLVLVLRRDRA